MGKKLENGGFTLVEIMIGCGLLAMLALAFAQMMTYQAKQQGVITTKAAFTQISQSVAGAAADTGAAIKSGSAQIAGSLMSQDQTAPVLETDPGPGTGTGGGVLQDH